MSDQTNIVIFKPGRDYSDIRIALDPDDTPVGRTETAILVWNRLVEEYPERDPNATGGHLVEAARAQGAEVVSSSTAQQQTRTAAPAQASQPSGGGGGQQFQSRAQKFPVVEGWACDECGGGVGRKAATGNMSSDAAVCLGKCKDGRYVHTVGWLDEEVKQTSAPMPQGMAELPPMDDPLPF